MYCFSFWTFLFSILGVAYSFLFTNLGKEYEVFLKSKSFCINLLLCTIFSTLGQVFIFQILEKFGPLTLSIITGVRKILSILLSIIVFNKSIGTIKLLALFLAGSIIVWEVIEKSLKHHDHHKDTKNE